jgi:hypothetical protein
MSKSDSTPSEMTDEERNQEARETPTSSAPTAQQPSPPDHTEEEKEEEKSPPYNLYFAGVAIGAGLIAYVATIIALIAFTTELDATAVAGALGALLTLIGTVSGAYFGIKKSSDTEDKADKTTKEAHESAKNAVGALDPGKWEELKGKGLL